jgi:hypothetical protein
MTPWRRETDRFSHSFTDLMAGVAAIFLLIAVVFILIAAKRGERIESQVAAYDRLKTTVIERLDSLRDSLQADSRLRNAISVDEEARGRDPFLFVVVFNRQRLSFAPTRCELLPKQEEMIIEIAPPVLSHVCDFADDLQRRAGQSRALISMTLEGHTDRKPFQAIRIGCGIDRPELTRPCAQNEQTDLCERLGFENNVRLSGARAQNVFFAMQRAVSTTPRLSACLERNFVVAGRGPVEPTDGTSWRESSNHDANRRVLLKIRAHVLFGRTEGAAGGK